MMPVRALRVSRYRPEARADGRIRTALATLAGPGVVLRLLRLGRNGRVAAVWPRLLAALRRRWHRLHRKRTRDVESSVLILS